MDRERFGTAVVVSFAVALLGIAASALGQPAQQAVRDKAAAQVLLAQGRQLIGSGKLEEGCTRVVEAYRLDPSAQMLLYVAQCHDNTNRLPEALAAYTELARKAAAANNAPLELAARRRADALRAQGVAPAATWLPPPTGAPLTAATATPSASAPVAPPSAVPSVPSLPAAPTGVTAPSAPVPPSGAPTSSAPSAGASADEVASLEMVGDARWTDGVGFVRAGDAPSARSETAEGPSTVPAVGSLTLEGLIWGLTVGLCSVELASGGRPTHAIEGGVLVADEFRDAGSWLAPWFDFGLGLGGAPDGGAFDFLLHGEVRLGLDLHPAALQPLGIGAFAVYGLALYGGGSGDPAHGPGLGGRVRLRSPEAPDSLPAFDAELSIMARENFGYGVAAYPRLRMTAGDTVRGIVYFDYRAESDLSDELRVGAGIGFQ